MATGKYDHIRHTTHRLIVIMIAMRPPFADLRERPLSYSPENQVKIHRVVRRTQAVDRPSTSSRPRNQHWLRHGRLRALFQKLKILGISLTTSNRVPALSVFLSLRSRSRDGNPVESVRSFRRLAECQAAVTHAKKYATGKVRSDLFYNGMRQRTTTRVH